MVIDFCWLIALIVAVAGNQNVQRELFGDEFYYKNNSDADVEDNDKNDKSDIKAHLIASIISIVIGILIQVLHNIIILTTFRTD